MADNSPTSPQVQAEQFLKNHRDTLLNNEIWAIVSARWMDSWLAFTGVDLNTSTTGEPSGPAPGPIDNSDLFLIPGKPNLKMGLAEKENYYIVTNECFDLLQDWWSLQVCSYIR